jgi:excisionase family DNA binding protein
MAKHRYTTILGEVIEYSRPRSEVAAFLERVKRAAHDPRIDASELTELVYGRENPLLDQTIFPGRGAVTRSVMRDPVYHVMLDLIEAKRVQTGALDANAVLASFTMTVAEAAARIGISPSAVRQAIAAKRLAAVKRGNAHFIDPRGVDAYRDHVVRRGPSPRTGMAGAAGRPGRTDHGAPPRGASAGGRARTA